MHWHRSCQLVVNRRTKAALNLRQHITNPPISSQSSAGQPTNTTTDESGPNLPILVHSAHPPPAQSIPPARHPPPKHLAQQQLKSFPSTSIGRALAQLIPIGGQSEDSCVSKRGTSVLCGPTEVSQRGTFSHAEKRCLCSQSHTPSLQCQLQSYSNPRECQSLTNLPIQCHSNANLIPICRFG